MAKWDLSKLPEGRKPLSDEWFREKAQMQERIEELEAQIEECEDIIKHDRARIEELVSMIAGVIDDTGDDPEIMAASRAEWAARAFAAEANLAKAVRSMTQTNEAMENWNKKQDEEAFCELGAALVSNHETIAELTGGNDD